MRGKGEQAFRQHLGLAAGAVAAGLVAAALAPRLAETRLGALVGVGLAGLSGAVGLVLKRRAMREGVQAALKVIGVVFGLRALLVVAGLAGVGSLGAGKVAFVAGFFGVYFALQVIEVSYVLAASRDAAGGDE